jgi:hypothetical protein
MKTVVMTMNITGLTHKEFRGLLDEMGVEARRNPEYTNISPTPPKPVSVSLRYGNRKKDLKNSSDGAWCLLSTSSAFNAKLPSCFSPSTIISVLGSTNCRL